MPKPSNRTWFLFAVACAACSSPETPSDRGHDHGPSYEQPPELPKLQSRLLAQTAHRTTEPVTRGPFGSAQLTAGVPRRITQKVLLLAATGWEPSYLAARASLERIGMPFQAVIASEADLSASMLTDGVSTCHFNAVLFATSGLGYESSPGVWSSALSATEWDALRAFEYECSAREAIWYAWPSPDLGLTYASSFDWTQEVGARVQDPTVLKRVNSSAAIPVRHAAGYRATIVDPNVTRVVLDDSAGGVLIAIHQLADGREVMVSTIDHSPYLVHTLTLEYDMLRWLAGGVFLGDKRTYLAPQIDDIFLDNDMWVVGQGNQATVQRRITGTDIDAFVAWQTQRQAQLPAGSTFKTAMAFNGVGTRQTMYTDATLLQRARAAGNKLTWLNHTWDHENLNPLTRAQARREVERNCDLAANRGLFGFSCTELVTPEVSGLDSLPVLRGLRDAGVQFVVSDTSVTEALRPNNPGTNPSFNVGRNNPLLPAIYQVPRHPTYVFYDTATPAELTDEFNAIYRSFYGYDLSYEEMTDKSSEYGLYYLLQGDIDPLMFHQANLANYGEGRSLYGDWVDAVMSKYLALSSAPVITLSQSEIGRAMQRRGGLLGCGAQLTIVESAGGPRTLEIKTAAACSVPVTGVSSAAHGTVELYAGEATTVVSMPANGTKSIPL